MVPPQHLVKLLAGAWTLINQTNGADPTYPNVGRLFYTTSGQVSAHVVPTNPSWRPQSPIYGEPDSSTDAEWAIIGKRNLAYSGVFDMVVLDESEYDDGIVTHHLDIANVPSLVGKRYVRNFTIMEEGKVLRLRVKLTGQNNGTGLIFWRRLE
ncbi:hypothetical protein BCR34DRAFT_604924 [Clohesyomyces aquaticus]|uniref:Lipocalin-like domain-containing protein n=1 Tax=Clohesyomyces aquaticus TaxID=1231657 RepID=A0A1Y1Z1V6_9PLEO|nr:hypothetical protein BCR34DRAFT_604924 [Clohesyomyces aquaticus]